MWSDTAVASIHMHIQCLRSWTVDCHIHNVYKWKNKAAYFPFWLTKRQTSDSLQLIYVHQCAPQAVVVVSRCIQPRWAVTCRLGILNVLHSIWKLPVNHIQVVHNQYHGYPSLIPRPLPRFTSSTEEGIWDQNRCKLPQEKVRHLSDCFICARD